MKWGYSIFISTLLAVSLFLQESIFVIITQNWGVKQWGFILVYLTSVGLLLLFNLWGKSSWGYYLFFGLYPFMAQTAYYLNFSSSFFILTPAFIYLWIQLLFVKEPSIPFSIQLLILFCLSMITGILQSNNVPLAIAFFLLASGIFIICTFLIYSAVVTEQFPLHFIRNLILFIIGGCLFYLVIETLVFGIQPSDVVRILMRNLNNLDASRYYTGGYREPAGLAFVACLVLWPVIFFIQSTPSHSNRHWSLIHKAMLAIIVLLLLITGSRRAFINIIEIMFMIIVLNLFCRWHLSIRIRKRYIFALIILVAIGIYVLLPRTIYTSRSEDPPPWIQPTYISVGGYDFQIIGTTPFYLQRSIKTFEDFMSNPLGTGPFDGSLTEFETIRNKTGPVYHSFLLSNLITVGAAYGWLSMSLWLLFILYVIKRVLYLKRFVVDRFMFNGTLIFLAILLASMLPATYLIGPHLNWANFERAQNISPQTPSVPAEYPAVLSGIIIGILLGLTNRLYKSVGSKPFGQYHFGQ